MDPVPIRCSVLRTFSKGRLRVVKTQDVENTEKDGAVPSLFSWKVQVQVSVIMVIMMLHDRWGLHATLFFIKIKKSDKCEQIVSLPNLL